eukprot:TRINITY_DN3049_c0_g1_i3.p1 TRINITY_DN3049_c0_g1~~TRINITY_DN3049_c0_g1_i3.p1  ORF type:complete len:470 (-),score=129.17 TRINITY_DN3049_c0_g1_i3:40-1449(-)
MRNYPWWPGMVVDTTEEGVPESLTKEKTGFSLIKFFGTKNFQWVEYKNIQHLSTDFKARSKSNDVLLRYSVEEAALASSNSKKYLTLLEETNCEICKTGEKPEELLLCDKCDLGFHTYCLSPPLKEIPETEWFCQSCKKSSEATIANAQSITPSALSMGVVGLHNLAASCFMNSAIQCLVPFDEFRDALFETEDNGNPLIYTMKSILRTLWEGKIVDPQVLIKYKEACGNILDLKYHNNEHQDLNEFLIHLLDHIHEHVKKVEGEKKEKETNGNENRGTFIEEYFDGMISRERTCPKGHSNVTKEVFRILTVPFPPEHSAKKQRALQLTDMLKSISGEENLHCRCEECGGSEDQTFAQKTEISQWPSILVLHLGRFTSLRNDKRWWSNKISTEVKFPLEGLDVSHSGTGPHYDLVAVANHMGGTKGGHYWAHIKVKSSWYNSNDEVVKLVQAQDVQSSHAYMLLYRRRQ